MTFTYDELGPIRKIIAEWVSDDSTGAATGTTKKITGTLIKVSTDPGAAAPTDNWDVVVTDEEGVDVLATCQQAAALVARDTANSEETYLYLKNIDATPIGFAVFPVVCDKLTIAVANAGNSKTGQITLFYRPG